MKSRAHAIFGSIAMLCIFTFWTSTLISELFLSQSVMVAVKGMILQAMWILIPAMVVTGGSGFSLAKGRSGRLVESKKKRMPFIALNGLLVLLPSAIYLHSKAQSGVFDTSFYAIQAVELVAGAVNLWLLSKNMYEGLKLAGRMRPKKIGG
ncbi:MAG: hypothetical protein RJB34_674 [Pseudomonadota bacterium]|jgi:hypothetical protein